MGTKGGDLRGCARPPSKSVPRLTLAPRQSQGENWGGCALQLHEFSLWRGATGQGEQTAGPRRRDACSSRRHRAGLPRWAWASVSPPGGVTLALLAARKFASTEANRRLTCFRQELEGREGSPGRGPGREKRTPALKHLALSSSMQGNLAPGASAFLGARSGESVAVACSPLRF